MNKYIDNLTVKEYEMINELLGDYEPILNEKLKNGDTSTKKYVELRGIKIKIQNIIKRYKKDNTIKLK